MVMEPQDFGGVYQTLWDQIQEGDLEGSRSLIRTLKALAQSETETTQLGAKLVLSQLADQMHDMVRTQDLEPLQHLERHEYEELINMLDPYED